MISELSLQKNLDKTLLIDSPIFCTSSAHYVMVPILLIICLPLQERVKGFTCRRVVELISRWLVITSKEYESEQPLHSSQIGFELDTLTVEKGELKLFLYLFNCIMTLWNASKDPRL